MQHLLSQESNSVTPNEINIKDQIFNYLQYWKWFVVSIFLLLSLTYVYLRYYVVEYGAASSILIKDEKKGGTSEFSAFSDLNIFSGKNNVDNEIFILKSRQLSQDVVKKRDLDISYFSEGRVVFKELYNDSPIKVIFTDKKDDYYENSLSFVVRVLSNKQFELLDAEKKNAKRYKFGQKVPSILGNFIVTLNTYPMPENIVDIIVTKSSLEARSNGFRGKLSVFSVDKTNVINLSITDQIPNRGVDFLNALVQQYNEDAVRDRNQVAEFTKEFINNRLNIISKELGGVEGKAEQFKKEKGLVSLESDAGLSIGGVVDYSKSILILETDLKVRDFLLDEIRKTKKDALLPTNVVAATETSTAYITEYNALVLEKRRLLNSSATESNPKVENISLKMSELRDNIVQSLLSKKNDLEIQKRDLLRERSLYDGKVYQVPTNDRKYNDIARQQNIKQSLYLYLLQKREETEISLAVTSAKAKVIDNAYLTGPISLKKPIFYIGAFVLGLLIPFGVLLLINLFDTKIKYRQDIEGKVSIPFLGDLPKSESNDEIIQSNSRTSSAEAIRMIRTNLEFMLAHVPENVCKTIFVTSSLPKEGKTFCAINLATTIALSGKKVLIIGLDIRNPKLDQYIELPQKGMTNYLTKDNEAINEYIVKVKGFSNFHALSSGVIPPNPVELLMNNKLTLLFDELKKQYDYIVVDTAPVSVVADTLLIAKNADCFVYVMRANYLDKRMLKFAESLYKDNKLPNMSIILNATEPKNTYGYGYGYGYGVEEEKLTFIQSIKAFFNKKVNK